MVEEFNETSIETTLAQDLTRAIRHFNRCYRPEPENTDLKPKMMMLLHFLWHKKHHGTELVSLSAIGEEMRLSPPSVTLMLNPMEKSNYILRIRDLEDRRVVFVQITDKGEKAVRELYEAFLSNARIMVQLLGEEDSRTYIDLMKKLTRLYREFMKKEELEHSHESRTEP